MWKKGKNEAGGKMAPTVSVQFPPFHCLAQSVAEIRYETHRMVFKRVVCKRYCARELTYRDVIVFN
jgi:hypothetical protein